MEHARDHDPVSTPWKWVWTVHFKFLPLEGVPYVLIRIFFSGTLEACTGSPVLRVSLGR